MRLDPPAAVQKAMHDTVRRMRVQQLGKVFPDLIPTTPDDDVGSSTSSSNLLGDNHGTAPP